MELAGEHGGRKGLGIGLNEASGADSGAAAPRALHTTLLGGQARGLGGVAIASGGLILNLLELAIENGRRKRLGIGLNEASSTDGSTLAPRALLAVGGASHAGILTGEGVTAGGAKRNLLVFAGEHRGRKRLGIRLAEAGGTNSGAAAPRALLASILASQAGLLGSVAVASSSGDSEDNGKNKKEELHFECD